MSRDNQPNGIKINLDDYPEVDVEKIQEIAHRLAMVIKNTSLGKTGMMAGRATGAIKLGWQNKKLIATHQTCRCCRWKTYGNICAYCGA
ncbi:MAG: hypothetical protein AAFV93_22070 [Chloroflexota bacterium]